MGGETAKQFLPLYGAPVLAHTLAVFDQAERIDSVIVVVSAENMALCRRLLGPESKVAALVTGGAERQDSVRAGLQALPPQAELVVVHDAARPLLLPAQLDAMLAEAARLHAGDGAAALIMAVPVTDTIKVVGPERDVVETPDRRRLWAAQTPQVFSRDLLAAAYDQAQRNGWSGTDDAALVERLGRPVRVFAGSPENIKLTAPADRVLAEVILERRRTGAWAGRKAGGEEAAVRVGFGYDVHRLVAGRPLILGGVRIDHDQGLEGHSDADVLTHAIMDALLGAAGLADIGRHFPNDDPAYKGADSLVLLERVVSLLHERGLQPYNIDCTVVAERPKLAPHVAAMRTNLVRRLGIPEGNVGLKATTGEGLGFTGRAEGIAAYAVATLVGR